MKFYQHILYTRSIFSNCDYSTLVELEKESRKYISFYDIPDNSPLYEYACNYTKSYDELDYEPEYTRFVLILLRALVDKIPKI